MEKKICYQITEQDCGKSIETFLKEHGFSRKVIIHLRKTELGITLNGSLAYTTRIISPGDVLSILLSEDVSSENIVPVPMDIDIVYEDEDMMVINKAAGVPVHPSQGHYDNTLANGLAWYFTEKKEAFVFRAVNRLDRDTTGLLLIAKNMLSGAVLSSMVSRKTIHREYMAVVSGLTEEEGTVCQPIARVDGSTIERCVDPERGEYACTHYRRLAYDEEKDCSLLLLTLDTGRTHQIRVHMKYIGHPLLGDFLYNPDYRFIKRQSLHSCRLSFTHPVTGAPMEFSAPLPEDFHFLSPLG
ncbi:RluA family pseudouridine synthase [[Clostridium] symbiosum]|uniref:RluA family pseudouridine synthase n=1 Tax=Clostridium symbiosum TaxID=1512 RepID=UPI001D086749|nr:RluA family pseudouridine synthase [[Clostridium] symbiosum]MCB6608966.1 RluA family pseudouridine synthase [[Clostridium] symbiosum]MCB6929106.1 RluA family pseudouridine synthase [[Clostridium] symbiosum]